MLKNHGTEIKSSLEAIVLNQIFANIVKSDKNKYRGFHAKSPPLAEIRKFSKWHAKSPPLVYPKIFLVQNREFPRFIKIPLLKTIFVRKKIWHAKSPPPFFSRNRTNPKSAC